MVFREKSKEFWKENRKGYVISVIVTALIGNLVYGFRVQSNPYESFQTPVSLIIIGFSIVSIFVLMWLLFFFIYRK